MSAIYNDEKPVKDLIRCVVYTSVIVTIINVLLLPYVMPTDGPSITGLCTTVTQDREYSKSLIHTLISHFNQRKSTLDYSIHRR